MDHVNDADEKVVRGTVWNLIGMIVPLALAVICIPFLIEGMGTDRFGMLTIAWVVMGYFSFFDFGLGRATTKYVSENLAAGNNEYLKDVIWSSIFSHIFLGVIGGFLLSALAGTLTNKFLSTPVALRGEIGVTFYMLAISVPLVVISAVFRGLLEAVNRFDLVNIVKIPSSVVNYIGPLIVVTLITKNLVPVVGIIVAGRAAVLLVYIFFCGRLFPLIKNRPTFSFTLVQGMLRYGGWLTVSNMISTILTSLDRFMIGAIISVAAVAYYATPYEIVTKLWLFSASLLAVLFPKFSAMGVDRRQDIPELYLRAVYVLLAIVTPFVALFLTFGHDLMAIWIGDDFAVKSTPVLKWLSIGVLINVLAQVPSTFMQSTGRADLPAKLHLCELPVYCIGIYAIAPEMGIVGVAIVWTCRAVADAGFLFLIAGRLLDRSSNDKCSLPVIGHTLIAGLFLCIFFLIDQFIGPSIGPRFVVAAILFSILLVWEWRFLLSHLERIWVCNNLKLTLARVIKIKNV